MLALLHTSPVHVHVFDAIRDEQAPELQLLHLVHENLLARAREDGPTSVSEQVNGFLAGAVAAGATAVLCTCSTIGAVAEASAASIGVPVLRVDRPMAAAVAHLRPGRSVTRIAVVAALASTINPTVTLIEEEAAGAWRTVVVDTYVVPDAWPLFEAEDLDGYLKTLVAAIDEIADADVIVLAQASMARAATMVTTSIPVLSSPGLGFRAAARAANRSPH